MRRDARELYGNDNVFLILDTYNDKRSGFAFRVNALGVVQDMAITNSGGSFNRNWDAVVDCQSHIHADRWTSEVQSASFQKARADDVEAEFGERNPAKYRTAYLGSLVGLEGITSKRRQSYREKR